MPQADEVLWPVSSGQNLRPTARGHRQLDTLSKPSIDWLASLRLETFKDHLLRSRRPFAFFVLASLLLAGCGVPISAADLTLTPETSPTPEVALVAVSSRLVDGDAALRPLGAPASSSPLPALTAKPSASPAASGTAGPSSTPTITPTSTSTPTATPFGTPPPTATPTPATGSIADQALAILNKYRTDSGRPPLRVNAALAAAANTYAKVMADNNWFYCGCDLHTGPDGSQPDQRVYRAGYTGQWKGEAIAGGQIAPSRSSIPGSTAPRTPPSSSTLRPSRSASATTTRPATSTGTTGSWTPACPKRPGYDRLR